ncbi:hypothetical protein [Rhizobium sp. AN69]|uniref:hypothetical protein n=1 Tax=Rhizobium sp. AN69 TaxID=3035213 RepID=UPI002B256DA8|nr:hypothetical protein [Rhizobium sp. AN69]
MAGAGHKLLARFGGTSLVRRAALAVCWGRQSFCGCCDRIPKLGRRGRNCRARPEHREKLQLR